MPRMRISYNFAEGVRLAVRRALLPITLLAVCPAPVLAEDATLAEIVVTAQKREQKLQDVPISISAVSGDSLESQGSHDFREVLLSIPGLSYSGSEPGQSNYSIRGVSTGASSPTTGIYLDDVSLITIATNFAGAEDPPLFDLERIEVLKGPQGTLYGGSAMGGAIKYVTRQPLMDSFEVRAAAGVADTKNGGTSYNAESVVNVPLVDGKIAMRVGLTYRDDAGYVNYVPNAPGIWLNQSSTLPPVYTPVTFDSGGVVDQRNANDTRTVAGRIAFKFAFDNGLTIVPQATIQRLYEAEPPYFWTNLPNFQLAARMVQPTHDNLDLLSLNVTQPIGPTTLTSLTSYSDRTREWNRDYTYFVAGLVPPLLANDSANVSDTKTTTFTEELRLASSDPKATFKWVAGFVYGRQNDALYQFVDTSNAGTFFGTGTDIVYVGLQATKTTQLAAFADVTYSFTPHWDASVGLRWFDIDQTYNGTFDGVFNGGASAVPNKTSADVGVNPKASITYRPIDDHMLYAIASKGFRPGGPNRFNTASPLCAPDFAKLGITSAPASFTSDSLWTYELGSKNAFNGGKVIVNASIYYTKWKNIQQQVNLPTCGFQFIGNVGAVDIKGGEVEFKAIVIRGLTVGGAASYAHSEVTATEPGVSAQVGQPVLDTPEWTGNAFIEVGLPTVAGWGSRLRADYQYHGSNLRQFDSTALINLPNGSTTLVPDATQMQHSYELGNVSLESEKGSWLLRLYVDNVTNASPILDYPGRLFNTPNATTLRPRTIGVSVRTKF